MSLFAKRSHKSKKKPNWAACVMILASDRWSGLTASEWLHQNRHKRQVPDTFEVGKLYFLGVLQLNSTIGKSVLHCLRSKPSRSRTSRTKSAQNRAARRKRGKWGEHKKRRKHFYFVRYGNACYAGKVLHNIDM